MYLTVAGKATISPFGPYPQHNHPTGYYFTWEKGRVLEEYQFILITKGNGKLQTNRDTYDISTGDLIIIRPQEYHRYQPNQETGWTEYYIGFSGHVVDHFFLQSAVLSKRDVVHCDSLQAVAPIFQQIFQLVKTELPGFQQIASGCILQLLGRLVANHKNEDFKSQPIVEAIQKARIFIRNHVEEKIDLHQLANNYFISYASFRKLFKQYTGMPPRQYHLELKIMRAKELLLSTNLAVTEIAEQLHFESVHYFSRYFKSKTGISPSQFKQQRL